MRSVPANVSGSPMRSIARVCRLDQISSQWDPEITLLVPLAGQDDVSRFCLLLDRGIDNLIPLVDTKHAALERCERIVTAALDKFLDDDVVGINGGVDLIQVLIRRTDHHHTIFITNRCNSYCLMCSQPPTTKDDHWLIGEALAISRHIRVAPPIIGFTGGEPLLAGIDFRHVLDEFLNLNADTRLEVLTNGRLLHNPSTARSMLANLPPRVSWMVPLYGHSDFYHDFIVQSPGAFNETIGGLLELASYRQAVQLRVVLVRPVLENLEAICEFVTKNLPFVVDVALMGCEPTGFALANRELCQVSYSEWQDALIAATDCITGAGIRCVIMNVPLCQLPRKLWKHTSKSISDWKNLYAAVCETCAVRENCCGLFTSHRHGWLPGELTPQREGHSS